MSILLNVDKVADLKGDALRELASELQIPGRSKMKVQELRDAIIEYAESQSETEEILSDSESMTAIEAGEAELDELLARASTSMLETLAKEIDVDQKLNDLHHSLGNGIVDPDYDYIRRSDNYQRMNNGGKIRKGKQARRLKQKYNKLLGFFNAE